MIIFDNNAIWVFRYDIVVFIIVSLYNFLVYMGVLYNVGLIHVS